MSRIMDARSFIEALGVVDGASVALTSQYVDKKSGKVRLSVPAWCIHTYRGTDFMDSIMESVSYVIDIMVVYRNLTNRLRTPLL